MSEVQVQRQTVVEAVYRALGESQRRRVKQVQLLENQINDLLGTLHRLKHDLATEDPMERWGRGGHWERNGELQGYGGKLDMRLAVLAGIDHEIRALHEIRKVWL